MPPIENPTIGQLPHDSLLYQGDRVDLVLRPTTTSTGKTQYREVCLHRGAVIILPILSLNPTRIVLIKNHRHTVNQTLLELPAGTLEYTDDPTNPKRPGSPIEDPPAAAARELTEETGYTAQTITPFGWFFTSPGILTEKMVAFLATNLTPGPQSLEDNEQIQTQVYTKQEILSLIRENAITDAKTLATLLKYFAEHP
jgi:ADP-ribose pyrophosphatase